MEALKAIVVLVGIALGALLVWATLRRDKHGDISPNGAAFGLALAVVVGTLALSASFGQVNAGFRGVVLQFGAATGRVLQPGLYTIMPFVQSVALVDVQIHAYQAEAIEAASHDLQDVRTNLTVNYQLDALRAVDIYTNLRGEAVNRILVPNVQETIKSSTAQFTAEQLIQQRPKVKAVADQTLADRVKPFWVNVLSTSITQFQFSKGFTDAIEAKVVAEQNALTAVNKLRQIEVEARQAAAQAEGEKNARIAKAQGEAEALRLQRTQVTPEILQLRWIEKWDGVMPQFFTGGGGAIPLINIPVPPKPK